MATSNSPKSPCTSSSALINDCPQLGWWGLRDLFQWEGFWYTHKHLEAAMAAKSHFKARDDDVFLASSMKTGTTWLKALIPSIMNRGYDDDDDHDDPLRNQHPNELIPSVEIQIYSENSSHDLSNMPSPRLFRTHTPYSLLPESIKTSGCKIVYVTRDPKDVFVSLWHYMNTRKSPEQGPVPLDEAFESFCNGVHPYGPFHDHVLAYWKESLKRPEKVLFLKYEDMKRDPRGGVKDLACFLGRPFADEEEEEVDKVLWRCSLERLKSLQINKDGVDPGSGFAYASFFRLGIVGDWKNKLSPKMKDRLDEITRRKLEGSGLYI